MVSLGFGFVEAFEAFCDLCRSVGSGTALLASAVPTARAGFGPIGSPTERSNLWDHKQLDIRLIESLICL